MRPDCGRARFPLGSHDCPRPLRPALSGVPGVLPVPGANVSKSVSAALSLSCGCQRLDVLLGGLSRSPHSARRGAPGPERDVPVASRGPGHRCKAMASGEPRSQAARPAFRAVMPRSVRACSGRLFSLAPRALETARFEARARARRVRARVVGPRPSHFDETNQQGRRRICLRQPTSLRQDARVPRRKRATSGCGCRWMRLLVASCLPTLRHVALLVVLRRFVVRSAACGNSAAGSQYDRISP